MDHYTKVIYLGVRNERIASAYGPDGRAFHGISISHVLDKMSRHYGLTFGLASPTYPATYPTP